MLVSGKFLDIVFAERNISCKGSITVFINGNDLDQTVGRDGVAVRGGNIVLGKQTEGDIENLTVITDFKGFVSLHYLCKRNVDLLPFVVE